MAINSDKRLEELKQKPAIGFIDNSITSELPTLPLSFPSVLTGPLKPARILAALCKVTSSPKERHDALALAINIGNTDFAFNDNQLAFIFTFYLHVLQSKTETTSQPILAVITGPLFSRKTRLIQVLASIVGELGANKLFFGSNSTAAAIAIGVILFSETGLLPIGRYRRIGPALGFLTYLLDLPPTHFAKAALENMFSVLIADSRSGLMQSGMEMKTKPTQNTKFGGCLDSGMYG
ncbi:hypothetical protein BT96DRAFT_935930 [Gymnopus androsaceus JB14]|uniref:Uncharacterized protein n=1 Tax=Gymnopus androsaceus JB14 TaxID=1447944 RepID=A0A6A4I5Y3_9AGAR|nr:hypothetical protein BT96DRAFT_935930 [Gymnopus androsaceus JB14]